MHKYKEWKESEFDDIVKGILMTTHYINKHKARDNGDAYSSSQLDDVKDCVDILHHIASICHMYPNSVTPTTMTSMEKMMKGM